MFALVWSLSQMQMKNPETFTETFYPEKKLSKL